MRLGIICPSEIALRRFMPALTKVKEIEFVGVAVCNYEERFGLTSRNKDKITEVLKNEYEKAKFFIDSYGGKIFDGYENIVTSDEIDVLYVPLPPALHYIWSAKALDFGKHVIVEKPATICVDDTKKLIDIANNKELVLHENYMFLFHKQIEEINEIIKSGELGDIRLYRITFGFPRRALEDFRYNKELGGGALIDAGGYVLKYAAALLGDTAKVMYAQLNYDNKLDVDIYGSGAVINSMGVVAQIAFGMDNEYKCELEVWGSKGELTTNRILTAPVGYTPTIIIRKDNKDYIKQLSKDDTFEKSIRHFEKSVNDNSIRTNNYQNILKQAKLVEEFKQLAKK